MIEPARYNVTIRKGVTFERTLTFRNPAGSLINWTGWDATLRVLSPGGALLADYSEYVTVGTTNGIVTIEVPANVTSEIAWTSGTYTLDMALGDHVDRWLTGNVGVQ